MPYTKNNLPDNVKKMPKDKQEAWMKAFNDSLKKDKDEEKAFKIANSLFKMAENTTEKSKPKYRKNNLPEAIAKLNEEFQGQWLGVYKAMLSQGKTDEESERMATLTIRQSLNDSVESLYYMSELKFAEGNNNNLEIMRTGKWEHPLYGTLKITEKDIDGFIKSFADNVRGVDLAIDLEHRETDKKGAAAGWIKSLSKVKDKDGVSLMGTIEWTELGEEVIKTEQYKYFSPEFRFDYKDNETGEVYKNVLFGGGLTNRPFIKNMQPVLLSEEVRRGLLDNIDFSYAYKEGGDEEVNKELLKALKLSEDANESTIKEAVSKLVEDNESLTTQLSEQETKLVEKDKEVKKLSEDNSTLKAENEALKGTKSNLETNNVQLSERVKTIEGQLNDAEWDKISTKALSEGKLTPSMVEKYKVLFDKDKKMAIDLIDSQPVIVKLDEQGSNQGITENNNPIELFEKEVTKIMNERKKTYSEALVLAEIEHPKLFEDVERVRFS